MKHSISASPSSPLNARPLNVQRSGFAAKEVVLAAAVVLTFTMGLYYLGERGFSRLYHFISTMTGSPWL
ncbi:MAG: hypothetical protein JNL58_17130 [Planctomyces sp.]|nr:hypothetical protein [Planctomyces sp.]